MLVTILSQIAAPSTSAKPILNLRDSTENSNLSSLAASVTVDPRFSVSSEYGWPALSELSCLMNAVHAMADLALQDFEEPIVPVSS